MSITCDVLVPWHATPEQLSALGSALWRWCNRAAGDTGIYQYLNSQALTELIAGKLPASSQLPGQVDQRGVHFRVRDETSQDRRTTIDSLRREIAAEWVEDVLVDDKSWNVLA
jgi:hypothetical protein